MAARTWHYRNYQGGWCAVYDETKFRIASVEREDHAKLITAAPELLSALQSVRSWLDSGQADDAAIRIEIDAALSLANRNGKAVGHGTA